MFKIEVNENIERTIHNIDASKAKVELAAVRALNKTASWLKLKAIQEISQEKRVSLKIIRKRLRITKARKSTLKVLIRAYLYDVRMGNIKQAKAAFNDALIKCEELEDTAKSRIKQARTQKELQDFLSNFEQEIL